MPGTINQPRPASKIKRVKKAVITTLSILLLIFIVAGFLVKREDLRVEEEKIPDIQRESLIPSSYRPAVERFIIQRTISLPTTLDYSWDEEKLIYATENGVFEAGTNKNIIDSKITYANFNSIGNGIYNTGVSWNTYDPTTNTSSSIQMKGKSPVINKVGDYVVSSEESIIFITNTKTGESYSVKLNSPPSKYSWAYDVNQIAISTKSNEEETITVYDTDLEELKKTTLPLDSQFIDISSDASTIAYKSNDSLNLINTRSGKNVFQIGTLKNSVVAGNWIDKTNFILIETIENQIGVPRSSITKVATDGTIKFLTTDDPMVNKIDTSIYMKPNRAGNVIPLAGDTSNFWILSLIPNQVADYRSRGVIFYPAPSVPPDHH